MSPNRHILATFDVKPNSAPQGSRPDLLMIDCSSLPLDATVSLYIPAVAADNILSAAARLLGNQVLRKLDAHTVGYAAQGITYVPAPDAAGNLAGLLDAKLPAGIGAGRKFTVVVSQLATQTARIPVSSNDAVRRSFPQISWREITGTFKLALRTYAPSEALPRLEQDLSFLRWVFESVPGDSRWRPVFVRYLGALASLVRDFGGSPQLISPSSTGDWRGTKPHEPADKRHFTGKIDGLIFDHFGDFEGFYLETDEDERLQFYSREANLRSVVERAWLARLRVTVVAEPDRPDRPRRLVLHPLG